MNNEDSPLNPEKKAIINKEATRQLKEIWLKKGLIPTTEKELQEPTTQKRLPIKELQMFTAQTDKKSTRRLKDKWLKKGLISTTQKKLLTQELQVSTTRKKLPTKELLVPTTRKKLPLEKYSNPNQTPLLKSLQISQKPLNKKESELLRIYLENEEKCIINQLKIDKNSFSKYMQDVYILLCQSFSTYDEAIEYFKEHAYKEITDQIIDGNI